MQVVAMIVCGVAGALLFSWLKVPGGTMLGSMLGTIAFILMIPAGVAQEPIPPLLNKAIYIALGISVGAMFRPGLFNMFWGHWLPILISTLFILGGGMVGAFILYKMGVMGPTGSYLATSPGGLSAATGLAMEMKEDAPMVVMCQMVRLYAIYFTAPFIGTLLHNWMK